MLEIGLGTKSHFLLDFAFPREIHTKRNPQEARSTSESASWGNWPREKFGLKCPWATAGQDLHVSYAKKRKV